MRLHIDPLAAALALPWKEARLPRRELLHAAGQDGHQTFERFAGGGAHAEDRASVDAACRELVRDLGRAGWTRYSVPADAFDVRALALIRETLAYHDGLADFAFAMQGLGSFPVTVAGSDMLKQTWLPRVKAGAAIACRGMRARLPMRS